VSFARPVSPNEKIWLGADRLAPFLISTVLEGSGALDEAAFRRAAQEASRAHPGARLVLRGFGRWLRWEDSGRDAPVRVVSQRGWDFLQEPMDVKRGPTCEVILWPGQPQRVAIRAHHAVMDGGGMATFALDLFRALRGEKLAGSSSTVIDLDVARSLGKGDSARWDVPAPAPTGSPRGSARGVEWRRISLPGRARGAVAPVVRALAEAAWEHAQALVRLHVAADLRRHLQEAATANLVGVISLEVTPETDERALKKQMLAALRAGSEARHLLDLARVRDAPLWAVAFGIRRSLARSQRTGLYAPSAAVSFIEIDEATASGGGFVAERVVGIPPLAEFLACIVDIVTTRQATDAIVAVPACLAGDGRLDALCARLEAVLTRAARSGPAHP